MKLGKEEIQKLTLGVLLFIGLIYSYFDFLLGPLNKRQAAAQATIATLGPEIASAQAQINTTRRLEEHAPAAMRVAQQVDAMIPEGSPVAWFPPRMAEFFKKQGIDKALSRLNGDLPEKELTGYRRLLWGVDLPKVEFGTFGEALAALENEEPLFEISTLQIDSSREDVEAQHALITVNNIVKQ